MIRHKIIYTIMYSLLFTVGVAQAATISVSSITLAQNNTSQIVVFGSINGEAADGVTILVELIPQIGAVGMVTFSPAASTLDEDILEISSPFAGGSFDGLDTNDTFSLFKNGSTRDSGATPQPTIFDGALSMFPIVASVDALGVWDIKLRIQSPSSASVWNPSSSIITTLTEGTITVTESFCNNNDQCNDGNPCTNDVCTSGICNNVNNTLPCDDGLFCTENDVCNNGTCSGSSTNCELVLPSDQCAISTCNELLGVCELIDVADNTPCDDGDQCTNNDTCQIGLCVAGTVTICSAVDQCHEVGTCNPATGFCSQPTRVNASICDDGDACTDNDQCFNGICSGSPINCSVADDQCNVGVCVGGLCEPQPIVDGTACDDSNICTENDQCTTGTCAGVGISGCATCTTGTVTIDCSNTNPCNTASCINNICQFPSNGTCPTLAMNADTFCYDEGFNNIVTVDFNLSGIGGLSSPIIAVQFFLSYDITKLSVLSIDPLPPFSMILTQKIATPGEIDYAASMVLGSTGTTSDTTIATITFQTIGQCEPFVEFRPHLPESAIVNAEGVTVSNLVLSNLPAIKIDGIPPVFTACQSTLGDIIVDSNSGRHSRVATWLTPVAEDGCDGPRVVTCVKHNPDGTIEPTGLTGDRLEEGTTTIVCSAFDNCTGTNVSNEGFCTFDVIVGDENEFETTIAYDTSTAVAVAGGVINTRCIWFDFFNCNDPTQPVITVNQQIGFTDGLASNVSVKIPTGVYTCVTAGDWHHTLSSTATDFTDEWIKYTASFTGDNELGGTSLISGNLNGDDFIDIIDFALMNLQWGMNVSINTDCLDTIPQADLSGNGFVSTEDFIVLAFNFGKTSQPYCCTSTTASTDIVEGPIMRISLSDLRSMGLGHLIHADINKDGWVDIEDIHLFLEADIAPYESNKTKYLKRRER